MNLQMIGTLILKDLKLYFSNQFFAFVTILGVVAYALIYFLLPAEVNETLTIGIYAPALPASITEPSAEAGLILEMYDSEEALIAAMGGNDSGPATFGEWWDGRVAWFKGLFDGEAAEEEVVDDTPDFNVGVVIPADIFTTFANGEKAQIDVFFSADFPEELKDAYTIMLQEWGYALNGQVQNIDADEEVLGIDMAGNQIADRDRMLPLFAVFILMVETLGLASLLTSEIETGTIRALLSTPLRVEGLFISKGIMGVGLAFVQAVILVGVTGGLKNQPLLIIVALLLGGMLATGLGFLIASVARDLMSVMGWGMLTIITLSIPTFTILFPGTLSGWVKVLPSYYLADTVFQVINFDAGWADVGGNLVALVLFSAAITALGIAALRRKFQ